MADGLAWPPRKEDLERLYLVEKLSAGKIAKIYGLRYKNPKVAESTVLYQLRKNRIKRRDPAEHVRKVTEQMVDEWVMRYQAGESLKQIARSTFSPVTVMQHLDARGVVRRNKIEAQIKAVTRHSKYPFSGSKEDVAYLIGLARGDLNVSAHGRAVRVKTATTHPLMIEHLRQLFGPYGYVLVSPRRSELAGFEWSFQVDLDQSFSFLIEFRRTLPRWIFRRRYFVHFIAGFFDAEGSISLNETTLYGFQLSFTNSDKNLLVKILSRLEDLRFPFHLGVKKGTSVWYLQMWQRDCVHQFLGSLPLKHPEKVAKAQIALRLAGIGATENYVKIVNDWESLTQSIKSERDRFVRQAKEALLGKVGG